MWTIYHNPRCSKSREALELLRKHKIEPTIIEYLRAPPDHGELAALARKLGLRPAEMLRTKEPAFKELGLDTADDHAVLEAIAQNPVLLERPVVVKGKRAVIGRPTEKVLELIRS